MARTYSQRPSAIVGIDDEWAAYQFDAAVLIESLDDSGGKGKPAGAGDWSALARL
jgi:hypothetical protein